MKIIIWLISTLLGVSVGTGLVVSVREGSVSSFVLGMATSARELAELLDERIDVLDRQK